MPDLRNTGFYRRMYGHLTDNGLTGFKILDSTYSKMDLPRMSAVRDVALEDAAITISGTLDDPMEAMEMMIVRDNKAFGDRAMELINQRYDVARQEILSSSKGMRMNDRISYLKSVAREGDLYHRMEAAKMLRDMAEASGDYLRYYNPVGSEGLDSIDEMTRLDDAEAKVMGSTELLLLDDRSRLKGQWHPFRNQSSMDETPNDQDAWWICPSGHEWHSSIAARMYGKECPICAVSANRKPFWRRLFKRRRFCC